MPDRIYFAPLGSDDAGKIARLQHRRFAPELRESEADIRRILLSTEQHTVCNLSFGMFDGARMVGYLFAYIETESLVYGRAEEVVYIKEIVLEPGYEKFMRSLFARLFAQWIAFAPGLPFEAHAQMEALANWRRLKRMFRFYGLTLSSTVEAVKVGRPAYHLMRLDLADRAVFIPELPIPMPPAPAEAAEAISCSVLTEPRQWLSLKHDWNGLLRETPDSNVFQSFEYLWEWWKYCGTWNDLFVVVIRRGDQVIGVAPLMVEHFEMMGRAVRKLLFITAPMEMSRPKLLFGANTAQCLPALLACLERHADDWDVLDIDEQLPEVSEEIGRHFKSKGYLVAESITICPFIDLQGTWAQFLAQLSKKMRSNVSRIRKRIAVLGDIKVRTVVAGADLDLAFESHCEIEQKSWKAAKELCISNDKSLYFFYESLTKAFGPEQGFVFRVLEADNKPLASTFGILRDGVFQSMKIAHDSEFDNLSPGTVLESYELEECFRTGVRRYEFMGSFLSNKLRWTSSVVQTANLHVYRKQPRLALFYFVHFVFKRWAKRVLERSGQFERIDSLLRKWKYNPFPRY